MANGTLGELGEFGLIDAVRLRLSQGPDVLVGPGDDAAVLSVVNGHVVASTDLLIEGRHFRRDWSSATDVGHKAAAQSLADIMAMGGTATALLVGIAAPAALPTAWALELVDGLVVEAALAGASLIGGDVSRADSIMIAGTALGRCESRPVLRSQARPGDVVAICGRLGWAAAGLAVLGRGFRSPRAVVDAHRRPHPPYAAGPEAAASGATAMIDVSDGLLADLGHLAADSAVAVDVLSARLDVPEPLQAVGAALGLDPLSFVLTGGEDHALAATFPSDVELPQGWLSVGSVSSGAGVRVDGQEYAGIGGHEHFR